MKIIFMLFFSIFLFFSCASQVNVLKPEGETVTLKLKNNFEYDGELFAVNDTALFFGSHAKLYEVPLSSVKNVYVHGYSLRMHKIFGSIPSVILWAYAFSIAEDKETRLQVGSIGALIILSWFIGDPKVSFSPPLKNKDFDKLRLYCRYSQDLTHEKLKQLLQYYEQEKFLKLQ